MGEDFAKWGMRLDGNPAEEAVYRDIAYIDHDLRSLPEGCDFASNTAHSIYGSQLQTQSNRGALYPSHSSGWGVFVEDVDREDANKPYRKYPFKCTLRDFTAYKTEEGGAWIEDGSVIQDSIFSDSNIGVLVFDSVVQDTVIVGQTQNQTGSSRRVEFTNIDGTAFDSTEIDFSAPLSFRGGVMVHPTEKDFHIRGLPETALPRYGVTPEVDGLYCSGVPSCLFVSRGKKLTPQSLTFERLSCRATDFCLGLAPREEDQLGSMIDIDGSIGNPGEEIASTDPDYDARDLINTRRIIRRNVRGFDWPADIAPED